jgi:2,4'-dihydroxyacetophenone dioxygenase
MPIERFKTYTDITPADRINFHDYIFDVTPEVKACEENWVPYVPGVHFIPLWFGTRSLPGFSNILRVQPGKQLNPHFHPGNVFGWILEGTWHYLEHDWVAKKGTFLWEPPGEAHTLVVPADAPEPMQTYFVSLGGLVYLDSIESGKPVAYDDGFTLLELSRKYYTSIGRNPDDLSALCR